MLTRKPNPLQSKTEALMSRIVRLIAYLRNKHDIEKSWISQLSRCGTSIGANIAESRNAQSRADFVSKLSIALKEADETEYWLRLLFATNIVDENEYKSLSKDVKQIIGTLVKIIKNTKQQ